MKRALAVLLTNAPTWESETVFEAINVEYATAIERLAEALANAPYDDLDRALEPSRAFVRGHDAGWSSAIAHTAERGQRTWVGLTVAEMEELTLLVGRMDYTRMLQLAEAKLKGKNA